MNATAIPVLPCRDLDETVAFYGRLGFELWFEQTEPGAYAILGWGDVELHFFGQPHLDADASSAGCYLRVADADVVHAAWRGLELPESGIPCLSGIADLDSGMREFQLVDPNGNRVRVGQILP